MSALLTRRTMDVHVYARMSNGDANDYVQLKKALLTICNFTEDGYRKRFREVKPETEETPDQFVLHSKNYLAKWLELSGDFDALVDLTVKEQGLCDRSSRKTNSWTKCFVNAYLRVI